MTRSSTITWMVLGASLIWSVAAIGQSQSAIRAADRKFVLNAARGGMAEVQMGQLATKNGASDSVKQFGERMVTDHSKANDELKQLAAAKGIKLPTALDRKHRRTYNHLSRLSAQSFDRAYAADMVKDHEEDVTEFEKEAAGGKDPEVKAWAAKTLPTLREHLQMARSLNGTSTR